MKKTENRHVAFPQRQDLLRHATGMFLEMGYEKASMNNAGPGYPGPGSVEAASGVISAWART